MQSELHEQAQLIQQLLASPQADTKTLWKLQRRAEDLERLEMQFSELANQVQAEAQAQHLLKSLSGTFVFTVIYCHRDPTGGHTDNFMKGMPEDENIISLVTQSLSSM